VASLDFVELITRIMARALRKVGQAFEQVATVADLWGVMFQNAVYGPQWHRSDSATTRPK
jgi:hypothetical protein